MKSSLHFALPGKPIAKQRPRFSRKGVYDCQAKEKRDCKLHLLQQMRLQGVLSPYQDVLSIKLCAYTAFPLKTSQKRLKQEEGFWDQNRPDLDNYIKFYLDCMNGIVFDDDKQVVKLTAEKRKSSEPKTTITVREIS